MARNEGRGGCCPKAAVAWSMRTRLPWDSLPRPRPLMIPRLHLAGPLLPLLFPLLPLPLRPRHCLCFLLTLLTATRRTRWKRRISRRLCRLLISATLVSQGFVPFISHATLPAPSVIVSRIPRRLPRLVFAASPPLRLRFSRRPMV